MTRSSHQQRIDALAEWAAGSHRGIKVAKNIRWSETGGRTFGMPTNRIVGLHLARQTLAAGESAAPLNALLQLRAIAQHFLDLADAERRKAKPCARAINDSLERAARVSRDITPYERPRLRSLS